MSDHLERAAFNGHNINIIMHQGEPHMSGEAIGEALGYANPRIAIRKIYERNQEMLEDYSAVTKLGSPGGMQETRIYSEQGMMFITMKSNQPAAFPFQRWGIAVMHAYRHEMLEAPDQIVALKRQLTRDVLRQNPLWQKIKRYRELGLTLPETGTLIGLKRNAVRKHIREMEACGLLEAPANLATMRQGALCLNGGGHHVH